MLEAPKTKRRELNSPQKSKFFEKINKWRDQVAAFEDESKEYIISDALIDFLEQHYEHIQHNQDLLNQCATFHAKAGGYVPFLIKIYCNELADIIVDYQQNPPVDLYEQILGTKKITHKSLEATFEAKTNQAAEGSFTLVGNPDFLHMLNMLQDSRHSPLTQDKKQVLTDCVNQLNNLPETADAQPELDLQMNQQSSTNFQIPETM
jgi:hypothetical protein